MFYFKTISIKDASPQLIEKAVRAYTVKRNSYLDFLITSGEYHKNKYFSGLERNDTVLLTRLTENNDKKRRSISRGGKGFPIIIRFKKANGFSSYQIRMNFFSMVLAVIWLYWSIRWTIVSFKDFDLWRLFALLILYTCFPAMVYMEIRSVTKLIHKAIKRTREDELMQNDIS
jgi:hypothetical protein